LPAASLILGGLTIDFHLLTPMPILRVIIPSPKVAGVSGYTSRNMPIMHLGKPQSLTDLAQNDLLGTHRINQLGARVQEEANVAIGNFSAKIVGLQSAVYSMDEISARLTEARLCQLERMY
jgi:hypothetical protein